MNIVAQEKKNNKRYLPHMVNTKVGAVKLYRQIKDIDFVLRLYHIICSTLASAPELVRIVQGTIAAAVINEFIAVIAAKKGFELAGEIKKRSRTA